MARKAAKPRPGAELSKQMLAVLEERATTADYPCVLNDVAREANPGVSSDEILIAAKAAPFKKAVIVAFVDEPDSLVALKADQEKLAGDNRILRELLSRLCSPQLPHVPVDSLKPEVASSLRAPLAKEWKKRIKEGSLPEFVRAVLVKPATGKGKGKDELHDVRFPLPWVALSKKLVEGLKSQQVDRPRTFTLAEIVDTAAGASESLIRQAIDSEQFSQTFRVVRKDGPTEWFAFSSDADSVVTQDAFLETMIHSVCTADAPEVKLSVFKKQLPKDLKDTFADHWLAFANRGESRAVFEIVKATKKDLTFRDTRFPKPEAILSEKLVAALRDLKAKEPASYPTTFSQLCARVGPEAGILIAGRAASLEPYRSDVIAAFPAAAESPIGLLEDVELVAKSPQLVTMLLPKHIKPEQQVVSVEKLARTKGLHADLQPFVQGTVEQMIARNTLPSVLGALKISRKWNLFFLKDVTGQDAANSHATRSQGTQSQSSHKKSASNAAAAENQRRSFASDFVAAFEELDRDSGHQNYLKLLDLRNRLEQYDRSDFDRGILDLCRARQFGLEGSEGSTVKLTEEERAAGITDAGSLLVYCRRRK